MPRVITEQDKIQINELYVEYGTYAAVARQMGISASTVKKYVVSNYTPQEEITIQKFDKLIPNDFPCHFPVTIEQWENILKFEEQELTDIEALRKEIVL
jgi:hypothetical protein